ncbi:hybrid sensor histidine kinase/response regulator [Sneathiella chinensis]|uniref:histidine kinase n=1 Tax=Sneathiella chinensis TaxID=349750 RepID=A0ABQ5U5A1_9PROT|nr:PAS domain-containing sensor histidine kinase [Sneathiella chinensis]GLQ06423.1 hypothetical protein GCM10007924_16440 [Sneathiella chinensis]
MRTLLAQEPDARLDDLFWAVFQSSATLMAITSFEERRVMAVNPAWLKCLGYREEEVMGKTAEELNLWHIPEQHRELTEMGYEAVGFQDKEVTLRARDGSPRTCILTAHNLQVGGRKLILSSSQDITQYKIASRALNATRETLIDALESINEGFVLYGPDDRVVICNSKFRSFYGYSQTEAAIGVHRSELGRLDIERDTVNLATTAETNLNRPDKLKDGPPAQTELKLRDGRVLYLSEHKTQNGGTVSIQSDISPLRHAEEALRRSQKMEAIGQLTGGIAHDFNNILNIIMGNVELIQEMTAGDDTIRKLSDTALKGVTRGAEITQKLLAFTQFQSDTRQVTDINHLIEGMEDLIAKSLTASISVETRLASDLWLTEIDPGDLEDAMLNLSLNARDAMPESGRLIIETANRYLPASGKDKTDAAPYVAISVRDTGIGMPPHIQEKIFEPFFTTKSIGKGTGLGLSMVYGFTQRSGGKIDIQSAPGEGTTITLLLPRATRQQDDKTPEGAVIGNPARGSETILVVDDEKAMTELASQTLPSLGYTVLTATNGEDALTLLKENTGVHLLFSDVIMPGWIDGYSLARQARDLCPGLKVLLASGYTRPNDQPSSLAEPQTIPAERLLQKPYSRGDLAAAVRATLDTPKR